MGMECGQYPLPEKIPCPTLSIKLNNSKSALKPPVPQALESPFFVHTQGKPLPAYFCDTNSTINMVAATVSRFGCEMPPCVDLDFPIYCREAMVKFFPEPLTDYEYIIPEDWLEKTGYSGSMKTLLREVRSGYVANGKDMTVVKSFIKVEAYEKPKYARAINSCSDMSKGVLGPIIKAIEKKVFKLKYFIKGQDPRTRPELMLKVLGVGPVLETDFSSFEAHHRGLLGDVMRRFIMHMLRGAHVPNNLKRLIAAMMSGRQTCEFKHMTAQLDETLMSGFQWTSLCNGVLNLFCMSYLVTKSAHPALGPVALAAVAQKEFAGLIEGDDGICSCAYINTALVTALGFKLKFDYFPNFGMASFCGMVCDINTLEITTDPIKFLRKFFLVPGRLQHAKRERILAHVRCKALSYIHQYPNCPVVSAIASRVCYLTRGIDHRSAFGDFDMYTRESFEFITKQDWHHIPEVKDVSRELVANKFNVSESDQVRIEAAYSASDGSIEIDLSAWLSSVDICHRRDFIIPVEEQSCWIKPQSYHVPPIIARIMRRRRLRRQPAFKNTAAVAMTAQYLSDHSVIKQAPTEFVFVRPPE